MMRIDFDIDGISNVQFKPKKTKQATGTFDTLDKALAAAEHGDEIVIVVNGIEQAWLRVVKEKQLPEEHPIGNCYIPEDMLEAQDDDEG